MNKVYIFSGDIHTGKTTRLMQWAISQKNIDGILQPVIDEQRFIYHLGSRSLNKLETEESSNIISIGKYKFSNLTFAWARNILTNCMHDDLNWIVIDEIGPLELDGKGFEPAISLLLDAKDQLRAKILCVVRSEMLGKFIEHYHLINNYEMFTITNSENEPENNF